MADQEAYSRYVFRGLLGYVAAPWMRGIRHCLVTIRHGASARP